MEPISTSAYVDRNGVLNLHYRDRFAMALKAIPDTPGIIIFEPHSNKITDNQRKYFYGVIVDVLFIFFVSTGIENLKRQDVVDELKEKFLFREKMSKISSRYIKSYISLGKNEAGMSHAEFTDKKEAIQQWAMEKLSVEIPEPDPNWRMYKQEK